MRLAVIGLAIIVTASAIATAFNSHQPSYAAPRQAKRNLDANGNAVVRNH
jgi:hypothetical protein